MPQTPLVTSQVLKEDPDNWEDMKVCKPVFMLNYLPSV